MPLKKYRTLLEIILFWVMPFAPLTFLFFAHKGSLPFSISMFFLFFPTLTMYLVVGIGAGYCKFWYFNTKFNIKGVAITVGLMYSSVVNVGTWTFFNWFESMPVVWVLCVGAFTAIIGTVADIFFLASGLFYIKSKKFPLGSNPIKHALSYGPSFFGLVGCWNAIGLITGYVVYNHINVFLLFIILPFLFALPFALFFIKKRARLNKQKSIKKQSMIV